MQRLAVRAAGVMLTAWVFCLCSVSFAKAAERQAEVGIEELLVTARLREEDPQNVPFAVTVLGDEFLSSRQVDDTFTLFRQAPGLALTSFDDGRFAYFQLRGVGPLSQAIGPDDGSVVTYVDGVPQPVFASEFAYLDLERIEILRGPQGTLYGRNSQGGAINIATRPPAESFEARVRLEGGEEGYGLLEASLSGPLAGERVLGRLSLRTSTFDGFIDNNAPGGGELGDRTTHAARAVVVIEPTVSDGFRVTVAANVDRRESDPFFYVRRGQPEPLVEIDPENATDRRAWGLNVTAEKPLGFANFTSITAVNGFSTDQLLDDTDGLMYGPLFGLPPSAFLAPLSFSDWEEEEDRYLQELRLSRSSTDGTAFSAGLVYFRSELDVELNNRSTFSPILNGDRDARQIIDSFAAYGEVTVPLFGPRLQGTAGLRYTRDEKSLEATFEGVGFPGSVAFFEEDNDESFDLVTGRIGLLLQATDEVNLYATVARGAKSGGFPRLTLNAAFGVESPAYAESTSWTYEAGLKANLLNGRAHFDLATFYNDVDDEQLFVLDLVAFQFVPVNLDTRAFGVELQGDISLNRSWTLSGGAAWTDAEVRDSNAFAGASPGNGIPNVPSFSSTFTLDYRGDTLEWSGLDLAPFLTLTHQYVGSRAVDVADSFDLDSYENVDIRLGAAVGRLELFLFGRNLLDEEPEINGVLFGPGVEASSLGRPRILGVGFRSTF